LFFLGLRDGGSAELETEHNQENDSFHNTTAGAIV
jgi:hypothetical protein